MSEDYNTLQPLDRGSLGRFNTPSYLSPTSFRVIIPRVPMLTSYIQSVTVPTVTLTPMEVPAFKGLPRQQIPAHLDLGDQIIVTFTVDENMENWKEVYDWMTSIVPSDENNGEVDKNISKYSEIIVLVYGNSKRLTRKITYHNAYPVSLSSFEFNSGIQTLEPIMVPVTFEYSHMSVELL